MAHIISFEVGARIKVEGPARLSDRDRFASFAGGQGREIEIVPDGIEGAETHIRVMDWQQKYKDGDRAKVTGTVRFVKDWQTQSGTKGRTIYLDNARLSAAKPLATPEAS